jgi:hypothetical protein
MPTWLDLAFDVDNAVGRGFGLVKQRACFSRQQPHSPILLLKQFRRGVIKNETCGLLIGLETKFLGDESDIDIWFVSIMTGQIGFSLETGRGKLTLYTWSQVHSTAHDRRTCP